MNEVDDLVVMTCKHCGKTFKGFTKGQVLNQLKTHLFCKHAEYYSLTERDAESLGYKEEEEECE